MSRSFQTSPHLTTPRRFHSYCIVHRASALPARFTAQARAVPTFLRIHHLSPATLLSASMSSSSQDSAPFLPFHYMRLFIVWNKRTSYVSLPLTKIACKNNRVVFYFVLFLFYFLYIVIINRLRAPTRRTLKQGEFCNLAILHIVRI